MKASVMSEIAVLLTSFLKVINFPAGAVITFLVALFALAPTDLPPAALSVLKMPPS